MNRIYRRIWNAARQCWVVASELSAPRGKRSQLRGLAGAPSLATCALLLAATEAIAAPVPSHCSTLEDYALSVGVGVNLCIDDTTRGPAHGDSGGRRLVGQLLTMDRNVAQAATAQSIASVQHAASAASTGLEDSIVQLGRYAKAEKENAVAIGNYARASLGGVAVGRNAVSSGDRSLSIGENSSSAGLFGTAVGNRADASALGSVAVGYNAVAVGTFSVSLGDGTRAEKRGSMAFGHGAQSIHEGSIALGENASTFDIDQVSFGDSSRTRKLVNVKAGLVASDSSEAVTGAQLFATDQVAHDANDAAQLANVAASDALVKADVALGKTSVMEGLIRQDAVGGSVRLGAENTGAVLDLRNKSNANRKITGLAAGAVGSSSAEAVTGAQLYSTDQTARSADTSAKAAVVSANSALGKVTELQGLVMQVSPTGAVRLGAENAGATLDVKNKSAGKRTITGVADGAVINGSSDAVTGNQLNATNGRVTAAQQDIAAAAGRLSAIEQASRYVAVGTPVDDEKAQAGRLGIAMGDSAFAAPTKDGAVALGSYSRAEGEDSVALGRAAWVQESARRGFALGSRSVVEEADGLALGAGSSVTKGSVNAVAIGAGSVAKESSTVSFGDDVLQRRLTNLARGTADHNATTVGQLNGSLATLGGGAKLDANGNVTAPTYRVQNTDQRTVGSALTVLDNAVLRTTSRVDGMEGQLHSIFQDTSTARADGFNQLTLAGAQGMVISNVANGLIAAGSREAVNGGQLHAVQQQLNGRIDGLEQRVEGNGLAPQSRAMALASTEQEAAAPTPPAMQDDKVVADTGSAPKSAPAPQPKADAPESPKPQVDTAELEKMLARANDYSDGIAREVDARLNKMDKRFNRMAAMSSAQTAMAMNTAGLATYNRLGAGVGYAEGESAMAVGYQRVLNDKGSATFSLNGAFTNSGERSMGVGVGIGW
ncbi:MAG: YadA-like family protein [Stenotrophomonas maltophilia]|uniref:ESPR-type extended signal peptide-containing protein n=1 Tax=Stenotrophomonas TaxID=40323 RepID=UPI0013DAF19B|nr:MULTISPECIES: ESPR-type extended signal peptide-containing protein [Stenotrophomonas]MBS4801746.1 YadA-like family protein [Stenotrophomonas maltophilia]MDG9990335.1 ESPR-type extended signal peptide-containing protein [Stenotrophomonas sp. GD04024]